MNSFTSWKSYEDFEGLNAFILHSVMSVAQIPNQTRENESGTQPGETCRSRASAH